VGYVAGRILGRLALLEKSTQSAGGTVSVVTILCNAQ
jgi:hypothetical protein